MDIGTIEATLRLRDEMAAVLKQNTALLRDLDKTINGLGGGTGLDRLSKSSADLTKNLTKVGSAISVGVIAPMAAVTKIASEFDSAFANVVKTVGDFDVDAFGNLKNGAREFREEIRAMAREIPVTADDLANIAAVGGQFGVEEKNLAKFTNTVARLAVSVDGISAEGAAAALQQISKIARVADDDFERLASTLVDLGNKGTSTEGTILEATRRFASAGTAARLSADQIMGLAASVSNLGFEAEVGGTALSKTFLEITRAVETGGDDIEAFARVAKMSASEFATAWKTDAADAFDLLIKNIGELQKSGANVATTMEEMFGKDIRQTQIIQALALAHGDMVKSLNDAKTAWAENSALADESRKKFATFANQVNLLKNQVYDVAIELGDSLLPVLRDILTQATPLIKEVGALARGFSGLPEPAKQAIVWLGLGTGLAGILMVVAGKGIEATKTLIELAAAIRGLAVAQGAATGVGALSGSLGGLAAVLGRLKALIPAGAGIAGMLGITAGLGFSQAAKAIDEQGAKMKRLGDEYEIAARASQLLGHQVKNSTEAWGVVRAMIDNAAHSSAGLSSEQVRLKGILDQAGEGMSQQQREAAMLEGRNKLLFTAMRDGTAVTEHQRAALSSLGAQIQIAAGDMPKLVEGTAAASAASKDYAATLAQVKAEAAAIPAQTKAQIAAYLELGNTVKEASQEFGLSEAVIGAFQSNLKGATKASNEASEALKKMREEAARANAEMTAGMLGLDALDRGAKLAAVIAKLPPGLKLTKEQAADAKKVLQDAFTSARTLGLQVHQDMTDAAAKVGVFTDVVIGLGGEFDKASIAAMKIPRTDFSPTVASINLAGKQTQEWNKYLEGVIRSLGILGPGMAEAIVGGMQSSIDKTEEAVSVTDTLLSGISSLTDAFAKLAQISGGSLDGWMGATAKALSMAELGMQSGKQIREGVKEGGTAGYMQAGIAAFSAFGQMQAATNKKGRGNRAMSGAAQGAAIGTAIMPGWGTVIGAAAGAIWGAVRNPMWEDIANRVGKDMGVNISDEMAKSLEASAKANFRGDRKAAEIFGLSGIIGEAGGLTKQNVGKLTGALRDAFSMFQTGKFTSTQLTQVLSENFGTFASYMEATGRVASKSFTALFSLAANAGATTAEMADYVAGQIGRVGSGLETVIANAKQAHELERAGSMVMAAFNGAQAAGLSWLEAVQLIGPAVDALVAKQEELNITGNGMANLSGLQELLDFRGLVEANAPLIAQMDALNQIALGLGNTGSFTEQALKDMTAAALDAITAAQEAGFTDEQALRMSEDLLANLAKGYQNLGLPMDEQLAALIAQADAFGLLKNDADILVTTLVEGFGEVTASVRELAAVLRGDLTSSLAGLPSIPVGAVPVAGEYPGMSQGGVASAGSGANATLHGVEVVSPLDTYNATLLSAFEAGAGGGRGPVYLTVTLDGQAIARGTLPYLADEMEIAGV